MFIKPRNEFDDSISEAYLFFKLLRNPRIDSKESFYPRQHSLAELVPWNRNGMESWAP
jgi:hypothetical protein